MKWSRTGAWLGALLVLGGCSLLRPAPPAEARLPETPPLEAFQLTGRISVKTETQSFSGGIDWKHRGAEDEILLSAPLGQGVAALSGNAEGVTLTDGEGRRHRAADAEVLLESQLGVRLPLAGLIHWLDGRPHPRGEFRWEPDSEGRVGALVQDGWRIDYGRYARQDGRWLPGRLVARHGEHLEFRLVVDRWELP